MNGSKSQSMLIHENERNLARQDLEVIPSSFEISVLKSEGNSESGDNSRGEEGDKDPYMMTSSAKKNKLHKYNQLRFNTQNRAIKMKQ